MTGGGMRNVLWNTMLGDLGCVFEDGVVCECMVHNFNLDWNWPSRYPSWRIVCWSSLGLGLTMVTIKGGCHERRHDRGWNSSYR